MSPQGVRLYAYNVSYIYYPVFSKPTTCPIVLNPFSAQAATKLSSGPSSSPDHWSRAQGLEADDGVLENTQGDQKNLEETVWRR